MTTRKRARAASIQQYDKIEELAAQGFGGRQIHEELGRLGLLDEDGLPEERTVQRIVHDLAPSEEVMRSEAWRLDHQPWQLGSNEPENAAVVLAIIADRIAKKAVVRPTVGQARWIGKLHAAVPDLLEQPAGARELYRISLMYQSRAERNEPTDDLDQFFALAPWRDDGRAYIEAFRSRQVKIVHGTELMSLGAMDAVRDVAEALFAARQAPPDAEVPHD